MASKEGIIVLKEGVDCLPVLRELESIGREIERMDSCGGTKITNYYRIFPESFGGNCVEVARSSVDYLECLPEDSEADSSVDTSLVKTAYRAIKSGRVRDLRA